MVSNFDVYVHQAGWRYFDVTKPKKLNYWWTLVYFWLKMTATFREDNFESHVELFWKQKLLLKQLLLLKLT